jgi:putative methyltransferase (TIGR04325 family)
MNIIRTFKYYINLIRYIFSQHKKKFGYNSLILNKSIINKTVNFNKFALNNKNDQNYQRTIKFINFIKRKKINSIIDFGGGAGYHFFIAKKKLSRFNLKWFIIENKTMVELCNKEPKHKNLFFFNSLEKVNKADIFFSSCAINYTQNPIKTLKTISKLNTKYLYFTRTPLTENDNLEYTQLSYLADNGPLKIKGEEKILIKYKNKITNIKTFEEIFKNKFEIIFKCIDEKNAFFHKNKSFDTYTYIIKKKKN